MPKPGVDELIANVKKIGTILRESVARLSELGKQQEGAIHEAVKIASLRSKDFEKEHEQDKDHEL